MQRISAFWSTRRQSTASPNSTQNLGDHPPRYHVKEDYWPATLDRETEKAARILHSFCTEGYIAPQGHDDLPCSPRSSVSTTHSKKKIPPRIVQNAVGLAIFSCMRSGLWKSGSGGSGILVARKSDGRWSPPSGLLLHTAALGFVIGVDVYDCVLVINSMSDLEMFTRSTITLGADVELAVGPVTSAGLFEGDAESQNLGQSVCTYVKARGEHRAVNIDGSLVTERVSENHRFYGREVSVLDVLAGHVPTLDFPELKTLYEVIKSAEGRVDFDAPLLGKLALQPAPGDALIENPTMTLSPMSPGRASFGLPDFFDPDPFGVKALEMAGLEIREAGTKNRPPSSQFEYNPTPTSPFFPHFNPRQSSDTYATPSNSNRASCMSSRTTFSRMTDAFTQTTIETRGTTPSSEDGRERSSIDRLPVVIEPEEVDYTQVDDSAIRRWSQQEEPTYHTKSVGRNDIGLINEEPTEQTDMVPEEADADIGPIADAVAVEVTNEVTDEVVEEVAIEIGNGVAEQTTDKVADEEPSTFPVDERDEDADDEDDDSDVELHGDLDDDEDAEDDEDEEEPVIFEVYEAKAVQPTRTAIISSQATQITQAKGAIVTIPKRVAPPVPPRSPARSSFVIKGDFSDIPAKSPLRNSFQSGISTRSTRSSLNGADSSSLDGVISSTTTEVAVSVIPTSPVKDEGKTPESPRSSEPEKRLSGESHRDSSIIFTSVLENRLSSEVEDIPKTPSTLQTSGHTSSGDEQEPRTPKPEDDMTSVKGDDVSEKPSHEEVRNLGVEVDTN